MTIEVLANTQVIRVDPCSRTVTVTKAGPPGPRGPSGPQGPQGPEGPPGNALDLDAAIAVHNQAPVVHTNATSGRDFSALFQNGLI